jgi:hypothetical protein
VSHPIHRLATSQSAVFLINSRLDPFTAPPSNLLLHSPSGGPLLPKLRGYIAEFLNEVSLARLGIFYPPTCVGLDTDTPRSTLRRFSWQSSISQSSSTVVSESYHLSELPRRIFLPELPTGFDHHFQSMADLASCVPPSLPRSGTGILNLFPINYAFLPRLRGRLTLGGRTFPRKS